MDTNTTIRVGLHKRVNGPLMSFYRCQLIGTIGAQPDEDLIEYVRTQINNSWGLNRGMLLNCIDNNDYCIERS